jgi:hypothetical protein
MPVGRDMAITWGILQILGNIIMAMCFTIAISLYVRRSCVGRFSRKKIILIILCMLYPLLMIGMNYKAYFAYKEFYHATETARAESQRQLINTMKKESSRQKKSRMTYLYAQGIYRYEGRITAYTSPLGKKVSYSPYKEDEEARRLISFDQAHKNSIKFITITNVISWSLALLGIYAFGFSKRLPKEQ